MGVIVLGGPILIYLHRTVICTISILPHRVCAAIYKAVTARLAIRRVLELLTLLAATRLADIDQARR